MGCPHILLYCHKKEKYSAPCPSAYIPRGAIKREEAKGSKHSPSPPKISECKWLLLQQLAGRNFIQGGGGVNRSLWLIIMVATAGQGYRCR